MQPSVGDADQERQGLRDQVYERILQMLLRGDVTPGSRLSIDSLARQLEVSPTPVREALVHLERTGLVTREALKGYRMAPPLDRQQLTELFEARIMVESTATRLATPYASELLPDLRRAQAEHDSVGSLINTAIDQDQLPDLDQTAAYFASDTAFHRVILLASQNRYLVEMSEDLAAHVHRMRQSIQAGVSDIAEATAEHHAIIDAFAGGDPKAPVAAMRRHLEGVCSRSLAIASP